MRRLAAAGAFVALAVAARADVYQLVDGDRVSGKTVSRAAGVFRVQTPYGRLAIPKEKIAKIVYDDGSEEVVTGAAEPQAAPSPAPAPEPGVRLVLAVTGDEFFQAWAQDRDAPADPTLRFAVFLDEELIAAWADAKPDPEIPDAVVNAMRFPAEGAIAAAPGVVAAPADARPGRVTLRVELPARLAGEHALRVAYQANDGTADAPAWRDAVDGNVHLELGPDAPAVLELHQDHGRMEFSRKKMRNVESFRIEIHPQ